MVRKYLSYTLLLLFTMQAVAALADVHQFHQTGVNHLEVTDNYDSPPDAEQQTPTRGISAALADQIDCDHCCHCHGISGFSLMASYNAEHTAFSMSVPINYRASYLSAFIAIDIRPPIA